MCPECRKFYGQHPFVDGKHLGTNYRSEIKCAFPVAFEGKFDWDNWNCRALVPVRDLAFEVEVLESVMHIALVPIPGTETKALLLRYYKHRGQTETLVVVDTTTQELRMATYDDVKGFQRG